MSPSAQRMFRAAYGRLCRLSAQALHDGYHRDAVWLASIGKSTAQDPWLVKIQAQQAKLTRVMLAVKRAGYKTDDFVKDAQDVKALIESEWEVQIPICASV